METAVVKREEMTLSVADIKKYIAPNATDKELFVFMGIAKSYGLNPLKREIHFVKYGQNPGQSIVGYEIYIKRAERTGKLDGWKVWIAKDDIGEKAVIQIRRKDFSEPFNWEVYRKEFDRQQANWKTMPYFMLKKVAIAQGFRLAFPDELGGMPYIPEELPKEMAGSGTSETLDRGTIDVQPEPPQEDIPEGLDNDKTTDQLMDEAGTDEKPPIDFPNAKAASGYDKGMAVTCPSKPKGKNLTPKTDCVTCKTSSTCVAWAA